MNLCSSCTNIECEFQSGIVRTKCAFYMPPHIEPDNCGNYVVMQQTDDAILKMISSYFPSEESTTASLLYQSIKQILSVQLRKQWTPVSEGLPESNGMYIVTRKIYDCPDTEPIIMSDECYFDGQNTWHNDNRINHSRGYLSDVIAWMPLPKPYESQESEEKR